MMSVTALGALALTALSLQFAPPAAGQDTGYRINDLRVSVWPEYDDPRVLVIYRGTFEERAGFPAWVDFYIPDGVEIVGAGIVSPAGQLLLQEYRIRQESGRSVISINLSIPSFFLEYYYDPFVGDIQKSFEQKIENKYPVDRMLVVVQQPLKAEDFTLTPQADSSETDAGGFTNYLYNFHDLLAENSVSFMVAYRKEDPNPSVPKKMLVQQKGEGPAPAGVGEDSPTTGTGLGGRTVAGIILLVAAAVVATALIVRRTAESRVESPPAREKQAPGEDGWNYCPRCGAQLKKDYRFCPSCGHDVKRGS